jgi:hypothetical protein
VKKRLKVSKLIVFACARNERRQTLKQSSAPLPNLMGEDVENSLTLIV